MRDSFDSAGLLSTTLSLASVVVLAVFFFFSSSFSFSSLRPNAALLLQRGARVGAGAASAKVAWSTHLKGRAGNHPPRRLLLCNSAAAAEEEEAAAAFPASSIAARVAILRARARE